MPNEDGKQDNNLPEGDNATNQSPVLRHSLTSIASSIFGVIGLVVFGSSLFISAPASLVHSLELARLCIVPVIWIIGLILAIIGLSRRKDRKLFPILGLVIGILYLCPLAITILGFVVSG
jgi:hypothetical protein